MPRGHVTASYTITTWTDLQGRNTARCEMSPGSILQEARIGVDPKPELARWMLEEGCEPTARVYFVGENGGKLGSARSLAELGRVK